jgi:hypothetical protein
MEEIKRRLEAEAAARQLAEKKVIPSSLNFFFR